MTKPRWIAYVLWLTAGAFVIACVGDAAPLVSAPIATFFVLSGSMLAPEYFGWRDAPRRGDRQTPAA